MNRPAACLGPEFEPFLYASVGEDANGMMLSVLSALARHDLDPWREAAELAALPVDVATRRLASSFMGLSGAAVRLDIGGAADRLVLLLPGRASSTVPQSANFAHDALGRTMSSLVFWMVAAFLIMGVLTFAASRQPPLQTINSTRSSNKAVSSTNEPPLVSAQ